MSIAQSGENNHFYRKTHSEETKKKLSEIAHSPERMEKNRLAHLGRPQSAESKEKNRQAHLGKHLSEESRRKISEFQKEFRRKQDYNPLKGYYESLKGKPGLRLGTHNSLDHRRKQSETMKLRWGQNPDGKKIASERARERWKNPDFIKKVVDGWHSKTRPERQLDQLLQQLYPGEFKYNGGFEVGVSIDGLIPDFVNVNNSKKIIEMNGRYFHQNPMREEDKISRYAKYGFSCLIIWDNEIKERRKLIEKIIEFVGKTPATYFEE